MDVLLAPYRELYLSLAGASAKSRQDVIMRLANLNLQYERSCLEVVNSRASSVLSTNLISDRYSKYRTVITHREEHIDALTRKVGTLESNLDLVQSRLGDFELSSSGNRGISSLSLSARFKVGMSSVKHWLKGSATKRSLVQELQFAHSFIRDMRASHAEHVDFL
jgi:hypothetical protein